MNIVLWIIAAVLAVAFAATGLMKAAQPKEKLVENMAALEGLPPGTIRVIGVMEILGAIGLVLPAALDIAPVLTPIAASGLVLMMLAAAVTHARRKEFASVGVNVVLGALALFVAIMRFGPQAF